MALGPALLNVFIAHLAEGLERAHGMFTGGAVGTLGVRAGIQELAETSRSSAKPAGTKRSDVIVPWVEGGFAEEGFGTLVAERESGAHPCNKELFFNTHKPSGRVERFVPSAWLSCEHISQYAVLLWAPQYKADVGTLETVQWMMGGWSTHCMRRG